MMFEVLATARFLDCIGSRQRLEHRLGGSARLGDDDEPCGLEIELRKRVGPTEWVRIVEEADARTTGLEVRQCFERLSTETRPTNSENCSLARILRQFGRHSSCRFNVVASRWNR